MAQEIKNLEFAGRVVDAQNEYLKSKTLEQRKEHGQYFTNAMIADYMASLIDNTGETSIRLLDAGAGSGILTFATAKQLLSQGVSRLHAVLYEIDSHVIPSLYQTTQIIKNMFESDGAVFTFDIINDDFVLSRPDLGFTREKYDVDLSPK